MSHANYMRLLVLVFLALSACEDAQQASGDVKLEVVKREELAKRLEAFRGKIVVLDVWGKF